MLGPRASLVDRVGQADRLRCRWRVSQADKLIIGEISVTSLLAVFLDILGGLSAAVTSLRFAAQVQTAERTSKVRFA